MGSYLFKWEHPAEEVYVTGTFDDWGKTQKLEKVGSHFVKNVKLSNIDEKIYYKFVVDDNWTTDHTAPQETDTSGNTNNVLQPEHIVKSPAAIDTGSSALPGAFPETPAAEQPSFGINPIPASTGIGNPVSVGAGEPLPPSTKSVTDSVTLDKASYDNAGSFAEEPSFGINPIPASVGIGNPVSVGAGEPVPPSTKSITDNVTLDKASYDKAGSSAAPQLPEVVTPVRERAAKGGMFGMDLTPGAGTIIPESGLAMGATAGLGAEAIAAAATNPHISSVGSNSTTAQLAGQVPLEPRGDPSISSVGPSSTTADLAGQVPIEPRGDYTISSVGANSTTAGLAGQVPLEAGSVPETVEKSQELAHAPPEASANPEAVEEKSAVENELLSKIPEAPATSDNSISGKAAGFAAGIAGTATAAAAGVAAYLSSGQANKDVKSQLPVAAQEKIDDLSKSNGGVGASSGTPIASTVPDTVQESISKAHQSPEAAANPVAVQEKSAYENELLQKTHSTTSGNAIAASVPKTVQESIEQSHQSPEAAVNAEAVKEKDAVESELLKKVEPVSSGGEPAPTASAVTATTAPQATATSTVSKSTAATSEGLAAPASSQAQSSAATPSATLAAPAVSPAEASPDRDRDSSRRPIDSRDISPMTRGPGDTSAPIVTTGVASTTTETKSTSTAGATGTPTKPTTSAAAASSSSTPASSTNTTPHDSPATDKKKNRRSGFFGRLKEKLEHRKDKH